MVVSPVLQVQVNGPAAVKVVVAPTQMVSLFTVTIGNGLTFICVIAVSEQPFLVPITVYCVIVAGACTILDATPPVLQVYVVAPLAINMAVFPTQIVSLVAVTVGKA